MKLAVIAALVLVSSVAHADPKPEDVVRAMLAKDPEAKATVEPPKPVCDEECVTGKRVASEVPVEFFRGVLIGMCWADEDIPVEQAAMAQERAHPSNYHRVLRDNQALVVSVIDKHLLWVAAAQVQADRQFLADDSQAYAKIRHHAWHGWQAEPACSLEWDPYPLPPGPCDVDGVYTPDPNPHHFCPPKK